MNSNLSLKWENDQGIDQIATLLDAAKRAEENGINARSIKYYLDGVLVQQTAAVLEPYIGTSDQLGHLQIPIETLNQAVKVFDKKGFQAYLHAIGDRAVRVALDSVAYAKNKNSGLSGRHLIAHLSLVSKLDQKRFGELKVAANFQPMWAFNHEYMNLTAKQVGEARMADTYPSNSILKAKGSLAFGSDWPVASANPFEGLEVAVTRREPGKKDAAPLYESESITLEQAIYAHTMEVAIITNSENKTGSLSVGKNADLIVVDQDIFSVEPHEISKSKVLLTLLNGEPVFGTWINVENKNVQD